MGDSIAELSPPVLRPISSEDHPPLRALPILAAVARRSIPRLLEASIIPAGLFYVFVTLYSVGAAMMVALCWSYGAMLRRLLRGDEVPGLLILTTVGLTVRTIVSLWAGSTFIYFIQPVVATVALAAVFLGSLLLDRPVVARLAGDFCPFAPDVACRPKVVRLFKGLTALWAAIHLITASITFILLVTLPVGAYVASKTVACLAVTCGGIALTVAWCLHTARHEGLVFTGPGHLGLVALVSHDHRSSDG